VLTLHEIVTYKISNCRFIIIGRVERNGIIRTWDRLVIVFQIGVVPVQVKDLVVSFIGRDRLVGREWFETWIRM